VTQQPKSKAAEFRREREASWAELELVVARVESSGLSSLDADTLHHLPALYRSTLSSLSVARAISLDRNLIAYLESLSARAYICVYGSNQGGLRALGRFLWRGFPDRVYQFRWQLLLATSVMLLGTLCGFSLTFDDPERFYAFVEPALAGPRGPSSSRQELLEVIEQGHVALGQLSQFASMLFSHNAKIGLMCFGLGFAAGVPVLLLLFVNGLMLGAMIAVHAHKGLAVAFLTWVLGHGVTELLAVCLCGAAGLALGQALVFPGAQRRLDNLARVGRDAGALAAGSVLLFFVAALLEGYVRQLTSGALSRGVVAGVSAVVWLLYFVRRRKASSAPAIEWLDVTQEDAPRSVASRELKRSRRRAA